MKNITNNWKTYLIFFAMLTFAWIVFAQTTPPERINYQGVLRDSSNKPLNGDVTMTFLFYDDPSAGTLLWEEIHDDVSYPPEITVSDGLFSVALGDSAHRNGGSELNFIDIFKNHSDVYLAVKVESDLEMTPRIKVISAGYALNADLLDGYHSTAFAESIHTHPGTDITSIVSDSDKLDGQHASYFLDTSSTAQTKSAQLTIDSSLAVSGYGVEGRGPDGGGYFIDSNNSSYAYVGYGDYGIETHGSTTGGYFNSIDYSGYARVGYGDYGIAAYGNSMGGYFVDLDSSGYARVGYGNFGIEAQGNFTGGYFADSDNSGYARVGYGDNGISAYGNTMGGYFEDSDSSGYARVGYGDYGISAYGAEAGGYFNSAEVGGYFYGTQAGGYFKDSNQSGYAYVGDGHTGISAYGNNAGGYFEDLTGGGYAYVGYGATGITATGNTIGGYFKDGNASGYAYAGYGNYGISAYGNSMGGYFEDLDSGGIAFVGYSVYGIYASGSAMGGHFSDSNNSGYAYVGNGDYGISAHGNLRGGYFSDLDHSGLAFVGYGDRGIWGKGTFAGATFSHPNDVTYWADVSTSTHKIYGTGAVSFVQNHPYDKSKVVTYAAPEGDEVAVYTRGTARLVNGEAVVILGESFSWVANPDIGLTAHITPRDPDVDIYVEGLSTTELLVRANTGSSLDATFDYIVFGLRIGFEEIAVVQAKDEREAFLPSSEAVQESYAQNPELKTFNALERFKRMRQNIGETEEIDLSRSQTLEAAIDENKQEILEKAREKMEMEEKQQDHRPEEYQEPMPEALEGTEQPHPSSSQLIDRPERTITATIPVDEDGNIHAKSFRSSSPDLTRNLPVSEVVETGDVLVVDPLDPQMMKPADKTSDPAVVGIVAGEPGVILGQDQVEPQVEQSSAAVALSGIVLCRVDANYGEIQIGDLLTTSSTKGHAMKTPDHAPGTIIGKALEPLDAGTGLIKVLVMMR